MQKFRLYPRFMPVTPFPLLHLWRITQKGRKKVSFLPTSLSFSKKRLPVCPPYHIPDASPSEDVTAEFQLNEISYPSTTHFPTRMRSDSANKRNPIPAVPPWHLEQDDGESQRNGYDYCYAIYRVTLMCVAQRRGTTFQCVWLASLLNETGHALSEHPFPDCQNSSSRLGATVCFGIWLFA